MKKEPTKKEFDETQANLKMAVTNFRGQCIRHAKESGKSEAETAALATMNLWTYASDEWEKVVKRCGLTFEDEAMSRMMGYLGVMVGGLVEIAEEG